VTDRFNNRVQVFSPSHVQRAFAAPESFGSTSSRHVYVSDFGDAVQAFSDQGAFLRKWGSSGRAQTSASRATGAVGIDVGGPRERLRRRLGERRVVVTSRRAGSWRSAASGSCPVPSGWRPRRRIGLVADTGTTDHRSTGRHLLQLRLLGSGNGQFSSSWTSPSTRRDLFVVDGPTTDPEGHPERPIPRRVRRHGGGPGQFKSPDGLAVDARGTSTSPTPATAGSSATATAPTCR